MATVGGFLDASVELLDMSNTFLPAKERDRNDVSSCKVLYFIPV